MNEITNAITIISIMNADDVRALSDSDLDSLLALQSIIARARTEKANRIVESERQERIRLIERAEAEKAAISEKAAALANLAQYKELLMLAKLYSWCSDKGQTDSAGKLRGQIQDILDKAELNDPRVFGHLVYSATN